MEKLNAQSARKMADDSDYVMNDVFGKIEKAAEENLVRVRYSFMDRSEAATRKVVESLKYMGYAVIAPVSGHEGEPLASDYLISW